MKYQKITLLLLLLHIFPMITYSEDFISEDKDRWKTCYKELTPKNKVSSWYLPFDVVNRRSLKYLSKISSFGATRNSFKKGHYHTGLDCMSKNYSEPVWVYAMAEGVVCSIHLGEQFKTVVIKHLLTDSTIVFTSYKHINDIKVSIGDQVSKDTKLARVLTKKEANSYKGAFDHLHLEIRKSFDDYGCASWLTMSKEELNYYFYDPFLFIEQRI
jgi:murein DD-endopeptidase MepM/ murein hydrolase activator NlpD